MNIEIGIGIGGGSLFAPTSNDRLIAYAWASALSPSVSTSAVIHATVNAVLANSVESALSPTVASAGNTTVLSVIANANGSALMPSVAIAGSVSVNAVVASGNADSMIPAVSTIRNVSVSGIVANSTASAGIPVISTTGVAPTVIVSDLFNRIDNTELGNADTGQTWIRSATGIGIKSNQIMLLSGGNTFAYIDSGNSAGNVSVKWSTFHSWNGFVFRLKDTLNYLQITTTTVAKVVAGAETVIATFPTITSGAVVKVNLNGNVGTVYVNGAQVATFTDSFNQTETKHGVRIEAVNTGFDDFKVETL